MAETEMNIFQWLCELHKVCCFQTIEGTCVGKASKSELKRWIDQGVVMINHTSFKWDEPLDFPVFSVIFFPKNEKKRCTFFHTPNITLINLKELT